MSDSSLLTPQDIRDVCAPKDAHGHHFELNLHVNGRIEVSRNRLDVQIKALNNVLAFSQVSDDSVIEEAAIAEVHRDNENNIVEYRVIKQARLHDKHHQQQRTLHHGKPDYRTHSMP